MFVKQSKGLQHCRDIKRDALNFYYLTGGITRDLKLCIKMALDDHVRLLKEDVKIMKRLKTEEAPTPVRAEYWPPFDV